MEVLKDVRPELLLQAVAVVPEQALQSIPAEHSNSEGRLQREDDPACSGSAQVLSPVSFLSVLHHQLPELLIHLPVEVISQEERPEAEERVHLLRLADSEPLSL